MLLNIDPLLTGELLKRLDELGHSEQVVIADAHFPAHGTDPDAIEYPGTGVPQVVRAICAVLPLDADIAPILMDPADGTRPEIFAEIEEAAGHPSPATLLGRWEFYERANAARIVVATGELRPWGNVILAKGLVGA